MVGTKPRHKNCVSFEQQAVNCLRLSVSDNPHEIQNAREFVDQEITGKKEISKAVQRSHRVKNLLGIEFNREVKKGVAQQCTKATKKLLSFITIYTFSPPHEAIKKKKDSDFRIKL